LYHKNIHSGNGKWEMESEKWKMIMKIRKYHAEPSCHAGFIPASQRYRNSAHQARLRLSPPARLCGMTWILLLFSIFNFQFSICYAAIEGGVSKTGESNIVMDLNTGEPVSGARVSLPKQNYSTYTDNAGGFDLDKRVNGQTLLSAEKDGYRPYSMTIDKGAAAKPMIVAIEKSNPADIKIGRAHV
jgi:hypothetical protein